MMTFFPASRASWQTAFVEACDSTNTAIIPHLKESQASYFALRTNYQRRGRGQRGTTWQAAQGQNLLASFGSKNLKLTAEEVFEVTMAASLGVTKILQTLTGLAFQVKWPNDIYIEERKVAGILVESQFQGEYIRQTIIGVGINLNQSQFDFPNATSLFLETGQRFFSEELFEHLLQIFLTKKETPKERKNKYLNQLVGFKQLRKYKELTSGKLLEGEIVGVNKWGNVLIRDRFGGTHQYGIKELQFLF